VSLEHSKRNPLWLGTSALGLTAAFLVGGVSTAFAQEVGVNLDEVVVTGSRTIRDGADQPSPVTVISVQALQEAAPKNLTEGLGQLPAFRNSTTTSTASATASYNNAGSFLNLRDLGIERTLVLLDGRRVAPASTTGAINVDLLPQPLISRVDVVTGGASAGYGSDAVAGVVNFILDTRFQGLKGTVQGGISDKGDIGSYKFDITAGNSYLDDRLHVLASYGVRRINPVTDIFQRRHNLSPRLRIATTAAGNMPNGRLLLDGRNTNYPGGVILGGTAAPQTQNPVGLRNIKFLPGGIASPYDEGAINPQTGQPYQNGTNQVGGDGSQSPINMNALLEVQTTFLRAEYEFSENLSIFAQVATGDTHNRWAVTGPHTGQNAALTIYADNYYLDPAVRNILNTTAFTAAQLSACAASANPTNTLPDGTVVQVMPAGYITPTPVRCFRMNKIHFDAGRLIGNVRSLAQDYLVGFNATIFGDWTLDGYYEHGQNYTTTYQYNNLTFENLYAGTDVIANPAVNGVPGVAAGAPICRARLTAPNYYSNCVPYNPFGFNSATPEAYDYVSTTSLFWVKARQDVAAVNLTGEPFELPAGPVRFAIGGEYRQLYVNQYVDGPSQLEAKFDPTTEAGRVRGVPTTFIGVPGAYANSNLSPFAGQYDVKEAFTELNVPLLKDLPLIQELSFNAAGRYTNYSTSGEVETWKVGLSYRPSETLRFRGTLSRDIRAPNSVELFQTGNAFQLNLRDPFKNNESDFTFYRPFPNPTLDPEEAESITLGVVFTPSWIPGFTMTVDYFDIEISGALENLTGQATVDACFDGSAFACANIQIAPGSGPDGPYTGVGDIQMILLPYVNLSNRKSTGADLELSWRGSVGPGLFNSRLIFGYITEQSSQVPGASSLNRAGSVITGDHPRIRGILQLGYDVGQVALSMQQRYIGSGYYDNRLVEGVTINLNRVGSNSITDVTGRYKFGGNSEYEAFLTITNLFDKAPPKFPTTSSALISQTNPNLYDQQGRYYTTGLRFKF